MRTKRELLGEPERDELRVGVGEIPVPRSDGGGIEGLSAAWALVFPCIAALMVVLVGCEGGDQGGRDAFANSDRDAPSGASASWRSRCIPGESASGCVDYPARRVDAPAEGHESSCTLRPRAAGGWVVDARVGTVATPSEGGVRFELRGVELDASGERAPADAECIVYVSEPGCTFGGSCASDCVVGATLEGDTFVGTVYCARLRCGDLFSVGSADVGGGEGASFSFSGCSGT
jgi:hypothetical protein